MVVIWFVARAPVGRRRRSRDNRKENNIPGQYRDTIIMLHRDRRPGNHFWNHYRFRKLDAWLCVISVFSFVSRVFSIAVRPRSCPFWKREVGKRTRRRPQSPGKNGNHGRRSHTAAYAGRRVRNESQLAGRRSQQSSAATATDCTSDVLRPSGSAVYRLPAGTVRRGCRTGPKERRTCCPVCY